MFLSQEVWNQVVCILTSVKTQLATKVLQNDVKKFLIKSAAFYARSPRILLASWMSFGIIVTLFAWMAHKFVSSNRPTR